jgi:tRNA(Met) cytidine acetyltransferase
LSEPGIVVWWCSAGDEPWTLSQATALRDALPGDWLWLNENPSKAISGLLGREYLHAVFDAHAGFDVSAFAASAERCAPGASWCGTTVLWLGRQARQRFLRWSDSAEPIATRTLFTIFAGRLPPIRMRSSGNSIIP